MIGPGWEILLKARGPIYLGGFLLFFVLETLSPLRPRVESRPRRVARNVIFAGIGLAFSRTLTAAPMLELTRWIESSGVGLTGWLGLKGWPRLGASLFLLDYFIYAWHVATHRLPFLWRFHLVHHVDLDMDVSTAQRFHFGEILISQCVRAPIYILLGIDPLTWIAFDAGVNAATQFHHSNWRLSPRIESWLSALVVTPRFHGVHHSDVMKDTNSNYGTILSLWDRLHGTSHGARSQEDITIGVKSYRDPGELRLGNLLALPLTRPRQG